MDEVVWVLRGVHLHNVLHLLEIDAPGYNIGGYQAPLSPGREFLNDGFSFLVFHSSVNAQNVARLAVFGEEVCEQFGIVVNRTASVKKYDHLISTHLLGQKVHQKIDFLRPVLKHQESIVQVFGNDIALSNRFSLFYSGPL